MEPSCSFPKLQISHLYQFAAVSGLVLIVVGVNGFATLSKERRTTGNQITREFDDSFRADVALQLQILQVDPARAPHLQDHLNEYVVRRQAEISALRRERLKENTASFLKVLVFYRWMLWIGIGFVVIGPSLWYLLVQRHRDKIERFQANREDRQERRERRKEQRSQKARRSFLPTETMPRRRSRR